MTPAIDYDRIAEAVSPDQLASAIGAAKDRGGNFHCPGGWHENGDRNPSLSITRNNGRTVALCHACGLTGSPVQVAAELWSVTDREAAERLASHIGLTTGAVNLPAPVTSSGLGEILDTYEYTDEVGDHLFEVVRFEPKDFRQRVGQGPGHKWGVKGVRKVLYKLRKVLAAGRAGRTIFVCEGEKDADNVERLGFIATTNVGGAGKWRHEYTETLKNGKVCLLPHNDEPGRDHACTVAHALHGIAGEVRVLELPDLPEKGDVSDWIDAGGTAEELNALVLAASLWEPEDSSLTTTPPTHESDEHLTDLGNAQRFVRLHGDVLRYVHEWGTWLVWDGTRWAKDKTGQVERLAKATVKAIHEEALELKDRDRAASMSKHAYKTESESRLNSMISLARSEEGVAIAAEDLDQDEWFFNCENGTVDLRTGELRPHDQHDKITKLAPVAYDPDAKAPKWKAFLNEVMDKREDLVSFLRRAMGYSLTGTTKEHVLFFLFGVGANGKSTFINTTLLAFGDYGIQTEPELLIQKRGDAHPTGLAALQGKRLAVTSEIEAGRRMAEGFVKQITGGDMITARFMRQNFFSFQPTHTIWLAANHKPVIRNTDVAIWRRIRLVPFDVVIPPQDRDSDLPDKLKAELPGILAWAVRGCLEWQEQGLNAPAEVRAATQAYKDDMDVLGDFIEQCCTEGPNYVVEATALYEAYKLWAEKSGERKLSQKLFGQKLRERGFEAAKDDRSRRATFLRIRINTECEGVRRGQNVNPLENSTREHNVSSVSQGFADGEDDDYERIEREAMQTEMEPFN